AVTLSDNGFLSSGTRSQNTGGNISLNVETLTLNSGGQILSTTTGEGNAGQISITAQQSISLAGIGTEFDFSSIENPFSSVTVTPLVFSTVQNVEQDSVTGALFANADRAAGQEEGFDYYSFEVSAANSQGLFDIDNGITDIGSSETQIDTELFLFNRDTGELLASNDDAETTLGGSGSTSNLDSFIDFTFAAPGRYVVGVGQFDSFAGDGSLVGGAEPGKGQTYDLRVSLANPGLSETFVLDNPNPNEQIAGQLRSAIAARSEGVGSAGAITINTPQLTLQDDAQINVNALDNADAGTIGINATAVTLNNRAAIAAETDAGGNIIPANITFTNLQTLDITDSQISSSTARGTAGNVTVNGGSDRPVNTIQIRGDTSLIAAQATDSGLGGSVSLNVQNLTVQDRAQITASNISASNRADSREGSVVGVELSSVEQLNVLNGGRITASTRTGTAGNVSINRNNEQSQPANRILVSGETSLIAAQATEIGGNAGNVDIYVETLDILGGGEITASTRTGTAGNVSFNGNEGDRPATSIVVSGQDANDLPSRIAARATANGGSAGLVSLNVQNLTVQEGGNITASNVSERSADNTNLTRIELTGLEQLDVVSGGQITSSTETGTAGSITIDGDSDVSSGQVIQRPVTAITVSGAGTRIAAQATEEGGDAGDVGLYVRELNVLEGGQITASTQTGAAGNVLFNTTDGNLPATSIVVSGQDVNAVPSRIAARAIANGGNAGDVSLNVQELIVRDEAQVTASNVNGGSAGNLASVNLSGVEQLRVLSGGAITASTQTGTAGNVTIARNSGRPSESILVGDRNSQISARATQAGGTAGSVRIAAQNLAVQNQAQVTAANVDSDSTENPASVNLSGVRQLSVSEGGAITASTQTGTAGNVLINRNQGDLPSGQASQQSAEAIVVRGQNSRIAARASQPGGNANNVRINVQDLQVLDGGRITASTQTGMAGSVTIAGGDVPANRILVSGNNALVAAAARGENGSAGDVNLNVRNLTVQNGARIAASNISGGSEDNFSSVNLSGVEQLFVLGGGEITASTATGRAGNIVVNDFNNPANVIRISGPNSRLAVEATGSRPNTAGSTDGSNVQGRAGALVGNRPRNTPTSLGTAGDLLLYTRQLTVEDGGEITVSSRDGSAGNLTVVTNAIRLDNGSLNASTAANRDNGGSGDNNGGGARITLQLGEYSLFSDGEHLANSLLMVNNSEIIAAAQGDADGGNITVAAPTGFIIGDGNSDIIATAQEGMGGTIELIALQVFGFQQQATAENLRNNTTNDISASSEFGASGVVAIEDLGTDPSRGLEALPLVLVDTPPLDAVCNSRRQGGSEFVQVGRGGVPTNPTDTLGVGDVSVPWVSQSGVMFEDDALDGLSIALEQSSFSMEAQGWVINADGTIHLVSASSRALLEEPPPLSQPLAPKACPRE
ncbi:MAG: S-layer family protein, partial [Merismopedia sp. SIO2A8]|nr:S-layer family protein [Merismopedia sp. SIO2A8]